MQIIPIEQLPKQEFSIRLDDHRYVIAILETAGCMSVNIERDGVVIVSGARAVASFNLMPYQYQEAGNFAFFTLNDELPFWNLFNVSQQLIYATQAELEAIRNGRI